MAKFTESIVEDAALSWLGDLGCAVLQGPEIAPGELAAERAGPSQTENLKPDTVILSPNAVDLSPLKEDIKSAWN